MFYGLNCKFLGHKRFFLNKKKIIKIEKTTFRVSVIKLNTCYYNFKHIIIISRDIIIISTRIKYLEHNCNNQKSYINIKNNNIILILNYKDLKIIIFKFLNLEGDTMNEYV